MSSVMLFLEIERIKNKIDTQMNMAIWPKFFTLLADPDATMDLSMDEFQDFLTTVAQLSQASYVENNAALTSQFERGSTPPAASSCPFPATSTTTMAPTAQRNPLSLFSSSSGGGRSIAADSSSANMGLFRKNCQKILKHYTLTNTSSTDFKVSDLVSCMIYLAKSPKYRPLYALLESSMVDEYECMPNYTSDEVHHLTDLLKNLLDLPTSIVDFGNIKILKSTMNKAMNYPVTRFARVIVLQSSALSRDKRCTLEELLTERGDELSKLEPQQYVNASEGNRIPYCDDEDFINELLKITDDFSIHRMFYNAANSIFYTTMENYAVSNCKFNVNDYNNIFKVMDNIREYSEKCGILVKTPEQTDSLNIYLGSSGTSNKRKKY
ncbi:P40 [Chrysodeixis chalcites nucleopolyhedrovirus]|uniref:p40 n=1 Tax=Chrysodeixis chalcites nucleopolyhedrovirus TaxID=320432 RepID=Q4KSY6_9ABAC|nr:P40 [Chrysodeixis chalcites nucleopolyhedrovirus]AAY84025.1 P40 [Chrysodeixis chalcites nucleopolyhedrovirus]AGE61355.1 P40 protein [Chrysodeixis chalcites nucleopolyhedrovirus]AGE61654.1 P40 protein [Chrysodeixis chalcites nucleopolyhedrovirus]AGE61803.1 P40 protein [Chrysodeixis chalcites nucleopolyhedrovirus]